MGVLHGVGNTFAGFVVLAFPDQFNDVQCPQYTGGAASAAY